MAPGLSEVGAGTVDLVVAVDRVPAWPQARAAKAVLAAAEASAAVELVGLPLPCFVFGADSMPVMGVRSVL